MKNCQKMFLKPFFSHSRKRFSEFLYKIFVTALHDIIGLQNFSLTAQPWAERGSCSARVFFFFFSFRVTRRRPPRMMSSSTNHRPNSHSAKCRHPPRMMSSSTNHRPNSHSVKCHHRMMSSSANYRPFLSSFPYTSPQESFVYNNVVVFEKIMLLMNFYFATSYSH